jgi:hypothetical protein
MFGCKEGKRLIQATGAKFVHKNNSPYDLAMDFGQWYKFSQRCFGVISIRCADMPADMLSKSANSRIVVLVSGSSEPKNFGVYLRRLIDSFVEFMPQGHGAAATGGIQINIHGEPAFTHGIFLARIFCDTPARQKMSNGLGHSAYHGCLWCMHRARHVSKAKLLEGQVIDMGDIEGEYLDSLFEQHC